MALRGVYTIDEESKTAKLEYYSGVTKVGEYELKNDATVYSPALSSSFVLTKENWLTYSRFLEDWWNKVKSFHPFTTGMDVYRFEAVKSTSGVVTEFELDGNLVLKLEYKNIDQSITLYSRDAITLDVKEFNAFVRVQLRDFKAVVLGWDD